MFFDKKLVLISVAIIVGFLVVLSLLGGVDNRPACEQLQDWIDKNVEPGEKIAVDEEIYRMCHFEHYITDLPGYKPSNEVLDLNVALRGSHTLYTYLGKGEDLNFTLTKRDKNWYEGKDELQITVSGPDKQILLEKIIPDDGIDQNFMGQKEKEGLEQTIQLFLQSPGKGVYKIELSCENEEIDLVIKRIKTTQSKLVILERIFNEKPHTIYFEPELETTLRFFTWHDYSLQNITIEGTDFIKTVKIDDVNREFDITVGKVDSIKISIDKGDVLIYFPNSQYFSFSEKSWFYPELIHPLKEDMSWIKSNEITFVVSKKFPTTKFYADLKNAQLIKKMSSTVEIYKLKS